MAPLWRLCSKVLEATDHRQAASRFASREERIEQVCPLALRKARAVVADILTTAIRSLDLRYPEVTEDQRRAQAAALKQLQSE